jgi:hypothetical protein
MDWRGFFRGPVSACNPGYQNTVHRRRPVLWHTLRSYNDGHLPEYVLDCLSLLLIESMRLCPLS